jgi:hypothetical protein
VATTHQSAPKAYAERTEESDIALAEQVLKISGIWADSSNGEDISCGKPGRSSIKTKVLFDMAERSPDEV